MNGSVEHGRKRAVIFVHLMSISRNHIDHLVVHFLEGFCN